MDQPTARCGQPPQHLFHLLIGKQYATHHIMPTMRPTTGLITPSVHLYLPSAADVGVVYGQVLLWSCDKPRDSFGHSSDGVGSRRILLQPLCFSYSSMLFLFFSRPLSFHNLLLSSHPKPVVIDTKRLESPLSPCSPALARCCSHRRQPAGRRSHTCKG